MKRLSLILAIVMLLAAMLAFVSCGSDGGKDDEKGDINVDVNVSDDSNNSEEEKGLAPADAVLTDMVAAINEAASFEEYVSEFLYKESDPDEMVCWTYGVIDINAYELLCDYAITLPSDYCNTLAILKFEDGMTEADFEEVKEVVTTEYIRAQASALQMYVPEQYACLAWALENPDAIWRQYGDNMLVLAITGEGEPTAVWNAIDEYLAG